MSIIAGIDPSLTSTGIAVLIDGLPELITSTGIKGHDADNYRTRSRRVRAVCRAVIQRLPTQPDLVVIEGPAYGTHLGSAFDRSGLWHGIYAALDAKHTPIAVVAPQTRSRFATGRGRAPKADVTAAVHDWWPGYRHLITDSDRADALVLAAIGALRLNQPTPFHAKDRHHQALNAIDWPEVTT